MAHTIFTIQGNITVAHGLLTPQTRCCQAATTSAQVGGVEALVCKACHRIVDDWYGLCAQADRPDQVAALWAAMGGQPDIAPHLGKMAHHAIEAGLDR